VHAVSKAFVCHDETQFERARVDFRSRVEEPNMPVRFFFFSFPHFIWDLFALLSSLSLTLRFLCLSTLFSRFYISSSFFRFLFLL
jgi:hypothetical protein